MSSTVVVCIMELFYYLCKWCFAQNGLYNKELLSSSSTSQFTSLRDSWVSQQETIPNIKQNTVGEANIKFLEWFSQSAKVYMYPNEKKLIPAWLEKNHTCASSSWFKYH